MTWNSPDSTVAIAIRMAGSQKSTANILISTLRHTYPGFAPKEHGTAKLIDVLERLDAVAN
jgi:hypothetical protein